MSFRLWHYLGRILVPVLLLASMLAIVARRNPTLLFIGVAAFVVLIGFGLIGGVMGFFLSRGTLRMRCPFCGQKGTVVPISGGLALECPACGLVCEAGFMKLRLEREAPEIETATGERPVEEVPQDRREELSLFPRGWRYFRRWRSLRWYLLMLLAPATGMTAAWWRGQIVSGCIVLLVSAAFGAISFVFLNSGATSSNWGTYTRTREPVRFWVDVVIVTVIYLGCALAGFVVT